MSPSHPPHLPPKSYSTRVHYTLQSLKWIILSVMIALLAGIAATSATVAWILPIVLPEQTFYGIRIGHNPSASTIDQAVVAQTKQRMLAIYDTTKRVAGSAYADNAHVSDAILLSADGWLVAPFTDIKKGKEKQWEVVDHQGVVHAIDKAIVDPVGRLSYIKIRGDGFRVMPFGNWENLDKGSIVFGLLGETVQEVELRADSISVEQVPIWRPQFYTAVPPVKKGSMLLDDNGDFVGFVDGNADVIPSWIIENQLGSLLQQGTIAYSGIRIEGTLVRRVMVGGVLRQINGFVVMTPTPAKAAVRQLHKGDIIIRVNNRAFTPHTLARFVLSAPQTISLTVLRASQEVEVEIVKEPVGT